MALSLENSNLVWQKVTVALMNANPAVQGQFKALKAFLAQQLGNANLQFVPYSGAEVAADGSNADKVIADAACKIYGFYAKKRATAVATWFKASDHNTTASPTDPTYLLEFNEASKEVAQVFPTGYAQGTGWTIEQSTDDISGSTRTNTADSVDGFYIVGAA